MILGRGASPVLSYGAPTAALATKNANTERAGTPFHLNCSHEPWGGTREPAPSSLGAGWSGSGQPFERVQLGGELVNPPLKSGGLSLVPPVLVYPGTEGLVSRIRLVGLTLLLKAALPFHAAEVSHVPSARFGGPGLWPCQPVVFLSRGYAAPMVLLQLRRILPRDGRGASVRLLAVLVALCLQLAQTLLQCGHGGLDRRVLSQVGHDPLLVMPVLPMVLNQ